MRAANTLWNITFGDYAFALDRKTLTYRLEDTKTGTVWADGLTVGWMEMEERETGARTRVDFGEMRCLSLSEKAAATGKRILLGLDWNGVPVDVYVTCAEREIQITVEASRDTRTYRVLDTVLYPGLVSAPDEEGSYLVFPYREGAVLLARDAPEQARTLPVWDAVNGLRMPFVGAVRGSGDTRAALALLTDSAYGTFDLTRTADGSAASLTPRYRRDPERRRLDVRLAVLPGGDHVAVARAYRDRVIGQQSHVLLRRKARETPEVEALLGGALIYCHVSGDGSFADAPEIGRDLKESLGVERGVFLFSEADGTPDELARACAGVAEWGFVPGIRAAETGGTASHAEWRDRYGVRAMLLSPAAAELPAEEDPAQPRSAARWEALDAHMASVQSAGENVGVVGLPFGPDWSAIGCDFWEGYFQDGTEASVVPVSAPAPLYAVVYHDSVVAFPGRADGFLRTLLNQSPPRFSLHPESLSEPDTREMVRRTYAVLAPLHGLTFPAFLTAHRFLTPDFLVEEAVYSDRTRVVVNHSATDDYEEEGLHLPPGGFHAAHPRMVAHDALRVGEERFATRAWRVRRSRDGKPLTESGDVLEQEFAAPV